MKKVLVIVAWGVGVFLGIALVGAIFNDAEFTTTTTKTVSTPAKGEISIGAKSTPKSTVSQHLKDGYMEGCVNSVTTVDLTAYCQCTINKLVQIYTTDESFLAVATQATESGQLNSTMQRIMEECS